MKYLRFHAYERYYFREVLQDLRKNQIDSKIKAEGLVVYNKLLNAASKATNRILLEVVIQIAIDKEASFQDNITITLEKLMDRFVVFYFIRN